MKTMKLFMILLGCKPVGRQVEQHDIYFGIAATLSELVPAMENFWKEANGKMHVDVWREVNYVDGYEISVSPYTISPEKRQWKLFFVNLGGYKPDQFDEFHYKQLVVAEEIAEAIALAKKTVFWKHHISSHIDDKYGLDVDDVYDVEDLLSDDFKSKYQLNIRPTVQQDADSLHIGYLKFSKLMNDEC